VARSGQVLQVVAPNDQGSHTGRLQVQDPFLPDQARKGAQVGPTMASIVEQVGAEDEHHQRQANQQGHRADVTTKEHRYGRQDEEKRQSAQVEAQQAPGRRQRTCQRPGFAAYRQGQDGADEEQRESRQVLRPDLAAMEDRPRAGGKEQSRQRPYTPAEVGPPDPVGQSHRHHAQECHPARRQPGVTGAGEGQRQNVTHQRRIVRAPGTDHPHRREMPLAGDRQRAAGRRRLVVLELDQVEPGQTQASRQEEDANEQ